MKSLRLRVVLDWSEEDVWRDLSVPTQFNLEQLHLSILRAFDLPEGEMASFYESDAQWGQGLEIGLMDMGEEHLCMNRCSVSDHLQQAGDRLLYIYDFLAMWTFFLEVIDEDEQPSGTSRLLLKKGERPAEAPSKKIQENLPDEENNPPEDDWDAYSEEDFY